jgi:3-oxoacyl-[acyl-carrier protein] reductase
MHLAADGMNVVLHGRQPSDKLSEVEAAILATAKNSNLDVKVGRVFGDFSQAIDWDQFAGEAWDQFGRVDHWVNNAGGDVLTGPAAEQSIEEKLDYLWRTDVTSTLMLSRAAGRRMIDAAKDSGAAAGSQSIVNIGWDQAANGMAGDSGELFATTKGAIMAMSKSLAQSMAPHVRVNCVAPGWIKTSWGDQTSEYWNDRARQESLMDRWGSPEDVATAVGFLCSDAAKFISGQVLPVNGGFRFGAW